MSPAIPVTAGVVVSRDALAREFDVVQELLITESWISLDYANQHAAREDVLAETVDMLTADGVLRDILVNEQCPDKAFLCHARREIAHHLIRRFGVRGV